MYATAIIRQNRLTALNIKSESLKMLFFDIIVLLALCIPNDHVFSLVQEQILNTDYNNNACENVCFEVA
jgi:hypothetical protein